MISLALDVFPMITINNESIPWKNRSYFVSEMQYNPIYEVHEEHCSREIPIIQIFFWDGHNIYIYWLIVMFPKVHT